jgi:hypothetical protein
MLVHIIPHLRLGFPVPPFIFSIDQAAFLVLWVYAAIEHHMIQFARLLPV